jgi:hypothetical protein
MPRRIHGDGFDNHGLADFAADDGLGGAGLLCHGDALLT